MAQYGRPNSDVQAGPYSPSTGETLYGTIDETSPSDADYIISDGTTGYAEVGLSSVTDPAVSTGHFVNYRIERNPTNRTITIVVILMQGATEIASWTHANYNGPGTFNAELSGAQADAITNYGTLSLRFDVTSSHSGGRSYVYWAEFEVPDVAANIVVTPATGELSLTGYAPSVLISDNKNIVTATGELVLAGFAPTVAISEHINVITSTGEMVVTGYAPTIIISGQTKYLVTKTGFYVTHNNMLITVDSDVAGDIVMLQEGNDGNYTELELTTTTTPPTFS